MGSGLRFSARPHTQTSTALSMKRTPAKQRMDGVSAASMANRRYPILMKGNAAPHNTLQRMAMATAAAGAAKNASSFEGSVFK